MTNNPEVISDEDDDSDTNVGSPELQGALLKWTNYIHGWQRRFIVLQNGTLSYYKSESETDCGCRGALSLFKASIKSHEFDECRFDVAVNDCVWYLRAESPEDKQRWVDILQTNKAESGYGSESSLKRHGSAVSLTSVTLSSASTSSYKVGRAWKERFSELETYRDILHSQMDSFQKVFDGHVEDQETAYCDEPKKPKGFDFKGEAMTFKATSNALLSGLTQCMEALTQREEMWRKKLDREHLRILKLEQTCEALKKKNSLTNGPDLELLNAKMVSCKPAVGGRVLATFIQTGSPSGLVQMEGPNSALCEDEFYDAVESALDKLEEEVILRQRLKQSSLSEVPPTLSTSPSSHPLWSEVQRITEEQIHYASLGVGEGPWQLFAEDGDMKMYRREEEVNGLVVDPLRACHIVKGVTGHEMCHYFFSPQYRKDWETTLEQMTVIEKISDNILVFLQVHKRIWPTTQRDALFWSHMTPMSDPQDQEGHDIWAVVNHSTQLPQYPAKSSKCVRVALTVCLYCQTLITPPKDGMKVTRDDITSKITYCSVVNPGGWVPATALRALYKREYPKFLKRFTGYVIAQTRDKEIMF